MATKNITPGTLQQTIGGNYATWTDLYKIKTDESGQYAKSYVYGQSAPLENKPNTPSKIIATNFKASIPENSKITGIEIQYRHSVTTTMTTTPAIGAPVFTLKNLETEISATGTAPPNSLTSYTTSFNIDELKPEVINNGNFGVEIAYPTNTNEFSGWVNLRAVKLVITYTQATYTIDVNEGVSQGQYYETVYKEDIVPLEITVEDDNEVGYDPTIEITLPDAPSSMFLTADGDGTMKLSGHKLYWKIPFSTLPSTTATATIYCKFAISSVTYGVDITEPLSSRIVSCHITVSNSSSSSIGEVTLPSTSIVTNVEPPEHTEHIYLHSSDVFTFDTTLLDYEILEFQVSVDSKEFKYSRNGTSYTTVTASQTNERYIWSANPAGNIYFQFTTPGKRVLYIKSMLSDTIYYKYIVHAMPDQLGILSATKLTIPTETLNRMGDGYVYTAQSYIKKTVTNTSTEFIDCQKNIRMIVFNNEIPSGTTDEIQYMLDHAEYISPAPEAYNTFENITVDFAYQEDYPVYILFTTDYSVNAGLGIGLKYTNPAIVEKVVYDGYEVQGNYPYPINNLLSDTNTASITIPLYQQSNSFLLSKPDLPEWYGTGEDYAVVGVEVSLDVSASDECALIAKLHAPDGRVGSRSIVLTDPEVTGETTVTLGGNNNLFGFDVTDIDNFNSWEIELILDDKYNSKDSATVVFNNATVTIYTEDIEDTLVTCKIDGKDIGYYGLYLIDAEIPEGLKTETKYLDITGTDAREAYRMNIEKKTITIEAGIDGCNLDDTTIILRRLAKLLINERDNLNRPIPKRLEFSHYPDLYWEYVMTETIDHSISISDYSVKIKLVIPSGTACSKEDSITNYIGTNNSLVKVNPILVITPTASELLIQEKRSGQKFTIKNTKLVNTDTITIDCENRKVKCTHNDETTEDITASVDYSSDWFSIHGEYEFDTQNAVIQTVTFNERW